MTKPRFENVSCSSCGEDFGPGDHGFSHCENHREETVAKMKRNWALYQAEKAAGLLRPQEEIDQDIRDAGRGHLVRP